MTIIQMQYFQAVCKYENFTKAAEDQHISQPAMSAAMKDLEAECGVPLFKKTRNSLTITEAGWALLEEIQANLRQYDHLMHAIKDLSLSRSYIRVGVSTLNGNLVYPTILSAFSQRYPDIQVISSEEPTAEQIELLNQGKLDVIITGARANGSDDHCIWPLLENEVVFCVSKDHPLAPEKSVTLTRVAQEPLVMMDMSFGLGRNILKRFEDAGLSCHVLHYTSQMYSIERFVESGAACGFLPEAVVKQNPHIVGIHCEDMIPKGWVNLRWRKDTILYPSVKAFIELVKELYPQK